VSQPFVLAGSRVQPELRAAWTHEFVDDRGTIIDALAGAPTVNFTQIGAPIGRDAANLGAGLSVAITQTAFPGQLSAFVEYDATVSQHQTDNAFAGGLKLTW
jgi:outer membrane autotransporter protein